MLLLAYDMQIIYFQLPLHPGISAPFYRKNSILPSITSLVANLHALEHTVMYHQDWKRIAKNFNSGYRKAMVNYREERKRGNCIY